MTSHSPIQHQNLTRFAPGSLKELLSLTLPLFLTLFSTHLLGFVERIWFSHLSTAELEASIQAVYVLRLFQLPCIALVMISQAFIGYHFGAKQEKLIGPCVWQFVWLSLFTALLIIPASFLMYHFYFQGAAVGELAAPYFFTLSFGNFLFPLASTLSCFYLGRGKTRFVSLATLFIVLLNFCLDIALIFGIDPWLPPLGLQGAAWASIISQGLLCGVLGLALLASSNRQLYATHECQFKPRLFLSYLAPALPRALGRLAMMAVWAANTHVMVSKGETHLLVLTVGGTISLFLTFLGDGLVQGLTVLISNARGQKNDLYIRGILRSSFVIITIIGMVLAIPLLIFPHHILSLFVLAPTDYLILTLGWIWLHTMVYILSVIPLSFLMAYKNTSLLLIANLGAWITSYLPIQLGMTYLGLSPDKFWLLASSSMVVASSVYSCQLKQKKWLYPSLQTIE